MSTANGMSPLYRMRCPFGFTSFQVFLANLVPVHRLVRHRVLPLQAVEQPAQLPCRDLQRRLVVPISGPDETALFEAPIMQPEAVGIPLQDLELVARTPAKDKLVWPDRFHAKRLDHHQRQGVNRFAHVGHAGRQIHVALGLAPHQRTAARIAGSQLTCSALDSRSR